MNRLLLVLFAAAFLSSSALAQFILSQPKRSISATGPAGGSTQTINALPGATFNESISSSNAGGTATASQNSTLGDLIITAAGTAFPGQGTFNTTGSARSSFQVVIRVPANQTFTLTGNFSRATGSLTGNGLNIQLNGQSGTINTSGTFIPSGFYVFTLETTGGTQPGQAFTGNFNFTLTLTGTVPVAQSSAFTYQGIVKNTSGQFINGAADFEFRLFPANTGAFQVGPTVAASGLPVSGGLFTSLLDFGNVFDGNERWLEVSVRSPAGTGDFTVLPRQRIQTTPYASRAFAAASVPWSGITSIPLNVSEAFSPWTPTSTGIEYPNAVLVGAGGPQEGLLNVDGPIQISTLSGALYFGGTTENNDLVAFKRTTLGVGASELRLFIGSNAPPDYFTIGTSAGGFTPVFSFIMTGVAAKPGGGSWAALSDPRAKHDIVRMTGTLDRLLALRGYEYFYNDDAIAAGKALPGRQIGLMADEVQKVFPNWIDRDKDGMLIVTERSTTALMVEALRDLRAEKDGQIAELKKRLDEESKRNAGLEERLRALEGKVR